jgi:hypothetical protein
VGKDNNDGEGGDREITALTRKFNKIFKGKNLLPHHVML